MNNIDTNLGSAFTTEGTVGRGGSDFAKQLLGNYNKSKAEIAIENMKKYDKNFNSDNIFALAFLATNESIPEEDREIFKQICNIKIQENVNIKIHTLSEEN